jgi:hypothetical protein
MWRRKPAANIVLAKAGQTEAVFQQLQHFWSVVRAGQATSADCKSSTFISIFIIG